MTQMQYTAPRYQQEREVIAELKQEISRVIIGQEYMVNGF